MLKIRFFLPILLLILAPVLLAISLLNISIAKAQEVPFAPPDKGNYQVQKATGAAFKEGWNFFTLGFGGCTVRIVLNELQADGGSALKAETLFAKEILGWQVYSILNLDSVKKKIGGGELLAFYSNQKFFFDMNQKVCSSPDRQRQAQIDRIGDVSSAETPFVEKVRDLPIDMWTKLMGVLNSNDSSSSNSKNTASDKKQIFENLTLGGKTIVDDLGITGKISSGLLTIDGLGYGSPYSEEVSLKAATINTLSNDLYLQNLGIGGVNFLSGKITIDKNGNLKIANNLSAKTIETETLKISSKSSGSAVLPANKLSVEILAQSSSSNSKILITPTTLTDKVLAVTQKGKGKFTVSVKQADSRNITFDWLIVN